MEGPLELGLEPREPLGITAGIFTFFLRFAIATIIPIMIIPTTIAPITPLGSNAGADVGCAGGGEGDEGGDVVGDVFGLEIGGIVIRCLPLVETSYSLEP